ncbi:hypothetical protein [Salibacterium qingdaonense]|uniref:Uncharacterized protein n=1 Tax=Salibacterium qingdaonense TaxID=266892 RepID=A0A1I4MT48_9BACI|nr:hypothetical protein [Salibacterium qingdaonense]SFM06474.1 hypothetical protein SAMN04488054_11347 [Salibacterium qingdaonense]
MKADFDYLSAEEKRKIEDLEEKVQHTENDQLLKRYTTEMTILYEKARVRKDTKQS